MNITELSVQADHYADSQLQPGEYHPDWNDIRDQKFAELIAQQCIDILEAYKIPVGNSAAGELACEWTFDALYQIRMKANAI